MFQHQELILLEDNPGLFQRVVDIFTMEMSFSICTTIFQCMGGSGLYHQLFHPSVKHSQGYMKWE